MTTIKGGYDPFFFSFAAARSYDPLSEAAPGRLRRRRTEFPIGTPHMEFFSYF
jgi:hypothetical protein